MNTHTVKVDIDAKITLILNEEEARALDGIFGYNVDAFLKAFYEKMGKAYVQPYERGVRSLHENVRKVTSPAISEIDALRSKLHAALKK